MRAKSIILFLTLISFYSISQNKVDLLNAQKKQLLNQINDINTQVIEIEKSKQNNLTTIKLQKNKIKLIESLLVNNKKQILSINENIQQGIHKIDSLNNLINKRRIELVTVYKSYYRKIKDKNNLLIIFLSSSNFSQAYSRLKMYKTLTSYFNKLIMNMQNDLKFLQVTKESYELYLKELRIKEKEYSENLENLKESEKKLNTTLLDLEKRKDDLKKEVSINQKKLLAIDNEIKKLIELSKKENKSSLVKNKEFLELSKNFKENKGKLPAPVNNPSILNEFGQSKHPILKNITIKNNGVDFIIYKDITVKTVFTGTVSKIFNLPYGGYAVIIRHGEFLTVYSNLSEVNVSTNQSLATNEIIGKTLKQPDNTYVLHFEVWNEKEPENPLKWINL